MHLLHMAKTMLRVGILELKSEVHMGDRRSAPIVDDDLVNGQVSDVVLNEELQEG